MFLEPGYEPEYQKWERGVKIFPTEVHDNEKMAKRALKTKSRFSQKDAVEEVPHDPNEPSVLDSYSALFSRRAKDLNQSQSQDFVNQRALVPESYTITTPNLFAD